MNRIFVHTLELTYRGSLEKIKELTTKCKLRKINGEYKCLDYVDLGISIKSVRCSNAGKDGKGNYMLILIVNPSRLICEGTFFNQITCNKDFYYACNVLNGLIGMILPGLSVNDMKLSRIDLTRDMYNIPEHIVQQYIMIMRKMVLSRSYSLYKDLEEHTSDFRCEESFNAVNSLGVEFVVYNKHKASADRYYPDDVIQVYEDTLRIELRCKRRLINILTKGSSTFKAMMTIFVNREEIMKDHYTSLFKYRTDLCYVSKGWQRKFIKRRFKNTSKGEKLLEIIDDMDHNDHYLDSVLYEHYHTRRARHNKLSAFNDMGFSPIPVLSDRISYMSPLDVVLGFCNYSEYTADKCYRKIKLGKGRKKEMFIYDPE